MDSVRRDVLTDTGEPRVHQSVHKTVRGQTASPPVATVTDVKVTITAGSVIKDVRHSVTEVCVNSGPDSVSKAVCSVSMETGARRPAQTAQAPSVIGLVAVLNVGITFGDKDVISRARVFVEGACVIRAVETVPGVYHGGTATDVTRTVT
jgi:hypothetical protein